jgi:hypothetical protein
MYHPCFLHNELKSPSIWEDLEEMEGVMEEEEELVFILC